MGDVFSDRDIIVLKCLGANPNPDHVFLDGNTGNGVVTLVKTTQDPFTGTKWVVNKFPDGDAISLDCAGHFLNRDHVFLDGNTINGSVGLAPNIDPPFTGTHWQAILHRNPLGIPDGTYRFRCLGHTANPDHVFLDGRTIDGSVGLAGNTALTGTHWEATVVGHLPIVN